MMGPEKRRRRIVELVTNADGISVSEIAEELNVSETTVRRDLDNLDDRDLIERTHGGAIPVTTLGSEPSFDERAVQGIDTKQAIGTKAATEIKEGQVVFFDSGTTTFQIAKEAPKDGSFVSVTNSPLHSIELNKGEGKVEVTGGSLRTKSMGLVSSTAENYVRSSNFDIAFIGTMGIDEQGIFTVHVEPEASLKRTVIANSAKTIVVADSDKFGEKNFREFATFDDIDGVVTDASVPNQFTEIFEEVETELLVAESD